MDTLQEEISSDEFVRWSIFLRHEPDAGDRVDVMCAKVLSVMSAFSGKAAPAKEMYSDPWDERFRPDYIPPKADNSAIREMFTNIPGVTVRLPDGSIIK